MTSMALNQTIYHLMTKTINHLLLLSLMLNFFFLQVTLLFSFVLLSPEKVEQLEKLFISFSAGDRHSLLEILL